MKIKKINQSAGYVGSIIDNLESTSNQDALSANQGKLLNETKANLVTTPQTLSGDRKVNSIEVLWDGNWKLGVNASVNGTTQDFTSVIQANTNIGDNSKYSSEEQIIGTWIDGKPIYRKVFNFESYDNCDIDFKHQLANLDKIWINEGKSFAFTDVEGKRETLCLNWYHDSTTWSRVWVNPWSIRFKAPFAYDVRTIYVTVEYTKTID